MRQQGKPVERSTSNVSGKPIRAPPGYITLIEFLREKNDLKAKHLLEISYSISEHIKELHEIGYALGGINFDYIFVTNQVSFQLCLY